MTAPLTPARFRTLILNWFDQHGRKNLPWQINKTPYRVWLSEIMLQQTQVNTVIPYFLRFLQQFPDLQTLSRAHEDEVLHLWAGLGYYSRARNLHRAARAIMENNHGEFPDTLVDLINIPGIGPSTAGAVLALAFNKRATILDGNVKRVLTRLHGIRKPINDKKTEQQLWDLAENYTPQKRIADYTQAMMDLGATCCTRARPSCSQCPLQRYCVAYKLGLVETLPAKKQSRSLPVRQATFVILKKGDTFFLEKRPSTGIWGSLWSLPELAGKPNKKTVRAFCQNILILMY
jgi:A/G-specific adenine glycosylase